jgi:hypothetical protein
VNKTEYIGKLNALYVGEKNCLEELITIYDEKDKEIERLNNIIKEVREYIKQSGQYLEDIKRFNVDVLEPNYLDILKILDKADKENKQ